MAVPSCQFVLTDLQGAVIGEILNASARSVMLPMNQLPTATFSIPSNHSLARYFIDPTWDGLLKVYRQGRLIFCGPVVTSQDQSSSSSNSIAVNAASPLWRFGFRFLGTTSLGWSLGDASTPYDLGYIAQQMILLGNSQGYTGVDNGSFVASSNGAAGVFYFQDILTAIGQLVSGYNSFEFEVPPTEPTNIGQAFPSLTQFNVTNLLGTVKPNAIFEYGTTKANLTGYSIQIDRSKLCNDAFIQDPASTTNGNIIEQTDPTSIATRGVYMALVDNGGVTYDSLRTAMAQENVRVRKQARLVVTVTPTPNSSPVPFTDYVIGDQVRTRLFKDGILRVDGEVRVWGMQFAWDVNGNETPTLTLIGP